MDFLSDFMQKGGPFMWPIAGLLFLAVPWTLVLAVMGFVRKRTPAFLWWAPALLAVLAGALGAVQGQHQAIEAISFASVEVQGVLAAAGHSVSLVTRVAGNGAGMLMLFGAACCAAVVAVARPGEESRRTVGPAIGAGAITALGGIALVGTAVFTQAGPIGVALGALLTVLGGVAVTAGGFRTPGGEADARRIGELRLVISGALIGAAVLGGLTIVDQGAVETHAAIAHTSAELKMTLMAAGLTMSHGGWIVTGVGAVITLVASILMTRASAGRLLDGRSIGSVALALLGVASWLALVVTFSTRAADYAVLFPN